MGGKILSDIFCNECKFITDNKEELNEHVNALHEAPTDLKNCTVDLEKDSENDNVSNATADKPLYTCGKCDFSTEDRGKMNKHMDNTHNNPEKTFKLKCDKCVNEYQNDDLLKQHFSEIHQTQKLNCYLCNFVTLNNERLDEHQS